MSVNEDPAKEAQQGLPVQSQEPAKKNIIKSRNYSEVN